MIYLDNPNRKIQMVLAGAVSANQLECTACFFDMTPQSTTSLRRGGTSITSSNNSTDVDIVAAPVLQGIVRNVHTIIIYNKDTASATITVKIDESGTDTILVKQSLASGESMMYEDQRGWHGVDVISLPVSDTTEIIKGSGDASKRVRFEADGISAGQTRVITVPDSDVTLLTGGATQAQMETGSSSTVSVTPSVQQHHAGHPKAWLKAGITGNILASYNITSVADSGTGDMAVTIATDFSSTNYAVAIGAESEATHTSITPTTQAAGTFSLQNRDTAGTLADPTSYYFIACGDQ